MFAKGACAVLTFAVSFSRCRTDGLTCEQTVPLTACQYLADHQYCISNFEYMLSHCGVTCGFCNGTIPTTPTPKPPSTTPQLQSCTLALCKQQPGVYNCKTCKITCKGVKCTDALPSCPQLASRYPCSSIENYCPEECGICNKLDCP